MLLFHIIQGQQFARRSALFEPDGLLRSVQVRLFEKIREVAFLQDPAFGHDAGAYEQVLQLPDVSGPVMALKRLHHVVGHPQDPSADVPVNLGQEILNERGRSSGRSSGGAF
jgi:hypothetical protein